VTYHTLLRPEGNVHQLHEGVTVQTPFKWTCPFGVKRVWHVTTLRSSARRWHITHFSHLSVPRGHAPPLQNSLWFVNVSYLHTIGWHITHCWDQRGIYTSFMRVSRFRHLPDGCAPLVWNVRDMSPQGGDISHTNHNRSMSNHKMKVEHFCPHSAGSNPLVWKVFEQCFPLWWQNFVAKLYYVPSLVEIEFQMSTSWVLDDFYLISKTIHTWLCWWNTIH
jgi:hypothetical protein